MRVLVRVRRSCSALKASSHSSRCGKRPAGWMRIGTLLLLLLGLFMPALCHGFSATPSTSVWPQQSYTISSSSSCSLLLSLRQRRTHSVAGGVLFSAPSANDVATSILEVTLEHHRPMGCTVEESLANEEALFVASVTPAGHADRAGVQVGDVLLAATTTHTKEDDSGSAAEWMDLVGGVQQLKTLLACRPSSLDCVGVPPLQLRLARGTTVLEDHERKIVELCANPEVSNEADAEVEQCMLEYLQGGYYDDNDTQNDSNEEECDPDAADCLVDEMYNLWAEDLAVPGMAAPTNATLAAATARPVPKPWSSRASPSGTFVRDPVTGQMKNIDS